MTWISNNNDDVVVEDGTIIIKIKISIIAVVTMAERAVPCPVAAEETGDRMPDETPDGGTDDIEPPAVAPAKGNVPTAMPTAAAMVAIQNNNNNAATAMPTIRRRIPHTDPTAASANEGTENGKDSDRRTAAVARAVESAAVERGEGIGSESREEEGMAAAAAAVGDREMENGVAGGAVRRAAANNAVEAEVDPVGAGKDVIREMGEPRNSMLGLPRFPVLVAAAAMPREIIDRLVIAEIAVAARAGGEIARGVITAVVVGDVIRGVIAARPHHPATREWTNQNPGEVIPRR